MSGPPRNPIEAWGELSARAARAGAVRDVRMERPRAVAAAAGLGLLTLAVVVVGAALVLRPGVGPAADGPVTATTDDGMFRIALTTPRGAVTTNDAIEPVATVTYLGPEPAVVVSGAARPILFSIQEVEGSRSMPGGARLVCVSTTLDKDRPLTVPFAKAGVPTSDASAGFDQAWYQEKTLRLPAGTWRITATLSASTGGCGGAEHPLTVTNEITVTPAAPNADPVVREVDDGVFRLRLSTPHGLYGPNDAIEPVATVTYLGPNPTETMWHAASPVYFTIEEVGGGRQMDGAMPAPCLHTEIRRDSPIDYPFRKSGTTRFGFDAAWYADPVLRLPVGVWRIRAALAVETTDGSSTCGGIGHGLQVDNVVVVVGDDAPSASPEPSPVPTIPSPSLSADAVTAREIARKYVDALETDHPEQAWPLLSAWSRTVIGSSATFIDAERRSAALMPGPAELGIPSQDPDLLDPAFLGDRAGDIKAVADASRTFVVSVLHPGSDGAAAGTETLVVAPVDGTWRIWPDVGVRGYRWAYPAGCAAFALSTRRCEAVIDAAASQASIDSTKASAIWLLPEPGCGGDPLADAVGLCMRTMSFVAGVGFESSDGTLVRANVFCGVGPPSLVCSDKPGIQAVDLHGGYWDVPCAGEAPAGCPSPLPSLSPKQAAAGTALRVKAVDVPVGSVGHREVDIGGAVLVDGLVQEARFSLGDQAQDGFALDPGLVRMELRSTIAGRPPFDNAYIRGTFDGLEPVRVVLVFDVAETSPGAVIHVKDVEVR